MFHYPWILGLLILVPLLAWLKGSRRKTAGITFSSTQFAHQLSPTWRQRLIWLPGLLWSSGLSLLIVALAGPRTVLEQTVTETEGIAIQLVVDLSGSMQARDFQKNGKPVDRLTAIKDVVSRFLIGDQQLVGRTYDLVGLVTFARFADGVVPATLDHNFLIERLNSTQIVSERGEDGTAIGDALGLATEKLVALRNSKQQEIGSKIVILLTDGENNAGELDPLDAADLAAAVGVKVYTIGVGSRGMAPFPVIDPFSGREGYQMMEVTIDEAMLETIAGRTGGRYFRATDTQSLEQIYAEIDELEKSRLEDRLYVDYRELAIQPFQFRGWTLLPVASWALLLLGSSLLIERTLFREFGVV
jgi:Ca-activated chloride channel family protein